MFNDMSQENSRLDLDTCTVSPHGDTRHVLDWMSMANDKKGRAVTTTVKCLTMLVHSY